MAASQGESLTTTGCELPEDLHATLFTGNAFNFFGVPALLGRGLQPTDAPEGADPEPVAVLGYDLELPLYRDTLPTTGGHR